MCALGFIYSAYVDDKDGSTGVEEVEEDKLMEVALSRATLYSRLVQ